MVELGKVWRRRRRKGNHLGSSAPPFPTIADKKVHLELNVAGSTATEVRSGPHTKVYSNLAPKSLLSLPPSPPRAIFGRDGHRRGFKWVLSRREGGRWRQVLTLVTSRARYTLEPWRGG